MEAWTIGRGPDNDIVIPDNSVSRRHAEVRVLGDGRYELSDVGSSNGTSIRGRDGWEPVGRVEVSAVDVVRFGDYEIVVSRLLEDVEKEEDLDERTVRAHDPNAGDSAPHPVHGAGGGDEPLSIVQAGVGPLDRLIPGLSFATLRAAGIVAIAIAGLTLVLAILNFAAPNAAALTSVLQFLLGLASIYVMLVLKKVLNEGYRFARANLAINLLVLLALVTAVVSVLFTLFAVLGFAALGVGSAGGFGAGMGLFGILLLVLYFAQGVLLILLGVALLKVKDQAGGLFAAFAYLVIAAGGLMCTVLLAGLGALVMLAAWVVLGIRMLQWADNPPMAMADTFD